MSVNFFDVPTERSPFIGERLKVEYLGYRAETLDTVAINNRNHVVQFMVGGKKSGFPSASFLAVAIRENHKNSVVRVISFCRQRETVADRKPVAKRTGRKFNPQNPHRIRVPDKFRVVGEVI